MKEECRKTVAMASAHFFAWYNRITWKTPNKSFKLRGALLFSKCLNIEMPEYRNRMRLIAKNFHHYSAWPERKEKRRRHKMYKILLLQSGPFISVTSKYLDSCWSYRKTKVTLLCPSTIPLLLNHIWAL